MVCKVYNSLELTKGNPPGDEEYYGQDTKSNEHCCQEAEQKVGYDCNIY